MWGDAVVEGGGVGVQEFTGGRTEEKLTEYTAGERRAGPQRRGCPQEAVGEGCL